MLTLCRAVPSSGLEQFLQDCALNLFRDLQCFLLEPDLDYSRTLEHKLKGMQSMKKAENRKQIIKSELSLILSVGELFPY